MPFLAVKILPGRPTGAPAEGPFLAVAARCVIFQFLTQKRRIKFGKNHCKD